MAQDLIRIQTWDGDIFGRSTTRIESKCFSLNGWITSDTLLNKPFTQHSSRLNIRSTVSGVKNFVFKLQLKEVKL